ncbi:hypothetical protein GYH30_046629 [Glycine max]|nr:hypothetical protein GYH30_046629 [Glycine max]
MKLEILVIKREIEKDGAVEQSPRLCGRSSETITVTVVGI